MRRRDTICETHLRPWHAFSREGVWYVVNGKDFVSDRVPPSFCRFLEDLEQNPFLPVPPDAEERLIRLHLLRSSRAERDPHVSETGSDSALPVRSLTIFVTQRCNMHCVYCYGGKGEYGKPSIMDLETGIQALEWLWDHKGDAEHVNVEFFGGEPFLNFELIQNLVAHGLALEKGNGTRFQFGVSTNATLLDEPVIAFLKKHRFRVLVGFDGPSRIQNRNRPLNTGQHSYETVVPKIKRLIAAMPDVTTLRATLMEKEELTDIVNEMQSLHPFGFQILPASPWGHLGENMPESNATGRHVGKAVEQMAPRFLRALKERDSNTISGLKKWNMFRLMLQMIGPRWRRRRPCGVGASLLAVSTEGDLYPCHRFVGHELYRLGDLFSHDLDRNPYLNPPHLTVEPCNSCWARCACNGGCIFDHLARTGHRFTPSEDSCNMVRSLAETAIHLKHRMSEEEQVFLYDNDILERPFCPLDI